MALTMLDKQPLNSDKSAWPPEIAAEFERERKNPNPCVGSEFVSESDRVRVWIIRLQPGERIGAVSGEAGGLPLCVGDWVLRESRR